MKELPNTKEIIIVLLSYSKYINMTLIEYHHDVYARKITATYYSTDGLIETYKTICIYTKDNDIFVQFDNYMLSYTNFKKRYWSL